MVTEALRSEGFEVVAAFITGEGLAAQIRNLSPDVVIVDIDSPDRDILENMRQVTFEQQRPVVMFAQDGDSSTIRAAIEAGVSAYVVDGLAAHRIRSLLDVTVRRFNAFARLQAELDEARGALAERDAVDKAKRILMDSRKMTEPEAYGELRRTAMNQGKRIADIAAAVVTAHQLLGGAG